MISPFLAVCKCICLFTHMSHVSRHPQRQEEGVGPYESGVIDNVKLLSIGSGN